MGLEVDRIIFFVVSTEEERFLAVGDCGVSGRVGVFINLIVSSTSTRGLSRLYP